MAALKSALHHWWPRGVSKYWVDSNGFVKRLSPDEEVRCAPPENFGAIRDGHHIKLSPTGGEPTVWDESFEKVFDEADGHFPSVIDWLHGLDRRPANDGSSPQARFHPVNASEDRLRNLVECLVSLAVRSPMNRAAAVSIAESISRKPLKNRERNSIIGLNIRGYQRTVADSIGTRGKFVVLFSPEREFIFGDGFFHNITSAPMAPAMPRILAPLTPAMSVLHAIPGGRYMEEPRMTTMVLRDDETEALNNTVQVYSGKELFFRSQQPQMTDDFRVGQYLCHTGHDHSIETFVRDIPGVIPFGTYPFDPYIERRH